MNFYPSRSYFNNPFPQVIYNNIENRNLTIIDNVDVEPVFLSQENAEEWKRINYFNEIPDEILLKIFQWLTQKHLGNLAKVCKRFYIITQDVSLWTSIDAMGKVLDEKSTNIILGRKPTFLRLAKAFIPSQVKLDSQFMSSYLTHLDLSIAVVEPDVLAQILGTCIVLQKVSLENLEVNKNSLLALSNSSSSLEVINMAMCSYVDPNALAFLLSTCQRLVSFNLGCIIHTTWTVEDIELLVSSMPCSVEHLNLAGFRNLMNDDAVAILTSRIRKVTDLDLSDSQLLTTNTLLSLVNDSNYLTHLGLSRCYSIEISSYTVLNHIPALRYLEIFSTFKEEALKMLTPHISGISINECPFSSVARPTLGNKRSTIWGERVRFY